MITNQLEDVLYEIVREGNAAQWEIIEELYEIEDREIEDIQCRELGARRTKQKLQILAKEQDARRERTKNSAEYMDGVKLVAWGETLINSYQTGGRVHLYETLQMTPDEDMTREMKAWLPAINRQLTLTLSEEIEVSG